MDITLSDALQHLLVVLINAALVVWLCRPHKHGETVRKRRRKHLESQPTQHVDSAESQAHNM